MWCVSAPGAHPEAYTLKMLVQSVEHKLMLMLKPPPALSLACGIGI